MDFSEATEFSTSALDITNQLLHLKTYYVNAKSKAKAEDYLEHLNQVKRIRASLNEIVKQKMDILDKTIRCEGENPVLNTIRLQITQSCSLVDSIEYHIKKGSKSKSTWDPIVKDLERLSTLENSIPQPRELVRKIKDPRNDYPQIYTTSIYEKEALELKKWMINGGPDYPSVIAICGMVGVGKTALATIAFNCEIQEDVAFQMKSGKEGCSAPNIYHKIWVSASGYYERDPDPLAEKITMLMENPSRKVAENLEQNLKEKSCLIILDDLQNISGWRWLKGVLNKSSRVIVTTSRKEIAQSVCKERLIQLEPLRQERALEIFCLRAFNQLIFPIEWPESQKIWAKKIVHHCGGLPLAIIAFADYVKELNWRDGQCEKLPETPYFFMRNDENDILKLISDVIKFRVRELPYHLMRCLMYFSLYPSGYVFNRKRVLKLLVSHNFIESENNNWTLEQLADMEIINLQDHFFLQVADSMGNTTPQRFWIHNVVRQVVLSMSENEYFGKLLNRSRDTVHGSNHHHVIVDDGVVENILDSDNLSSISFLGPKKIPKDFCSKKPRFMLLRVLSLRNSEIQDADDVKNLLLLQYLDLKYTNVKTCGWLKFLEELQTLDMRYTGIEAVPDECLQKLKKLRHLLLGYVRNRMMVLLGKTTKDVYGATRSWVPKELRNPLESSINDNFGGRDTYILEGAAVNFKKLHKQNMQTIRAVRASQDLDNLSEIVDLFITDIKKKEMKSMWNLVEKLENLTSFGLASKSEIDVQLGGPQLKARLQKLHIQGSLSGPFEDLCKFENLNELTVASSGYKESFPIESLSALSNLRCLKLYKVTKEKTLTFGPHGFRNLIKLKIADMKKLELIKIGSDVMGKLATLKLCGLPKLAGVAVLEMDGSLDKETYKYIIQTKEAQNLGSLHQIQSLRSIFLRDMNDVDIIYGPDVYQFDRDKKCYIADA